MGTNGTQGDTVSLTDLGVVGYLLLHKVEPLRIEPGMGAMRKLAFVFPAAAKSLVERYHQSAQVIASDFDAAVRSARATMHRFQRGGM